VHRNKKIKVNQLSDEFFFVMPGTFAKISWRGVSRDPEEQLRYEMEKQKAAVEKKRRKKIQEHESPSRRTDSITCSDISDFSLASKSTIFEESMAREIPEVIITRAKTDYPIGSKAVTFDKVGYRSRSRSPMRSPYFSARASTETALKTSLSKLVGKKAELYDNVPPAFLALQSGISVAFTSILEQDARTFLSFLDLQTILSLSLAYRLQLETILVTKRFDEVFIDEQEDLVIAWKKGVATHHPEELTLQEVSSQMQFICDIHGNSASLLKLKRANKFAAWFNEGARKGTCVTWGDVPKKLRSKVRSNKISHLRADFKSGQFIGKTAKGEIIW